MVFLLVSFYKSLNYTKFLKKIKLQLKLLANDNVLFRLKQTTTNLEKDK